MQCNFDTSIKSLKDITNKKYNSQIKTQLLDLSNTKYKLLQNLKSHLQNQYKIINHHQKNQTLRQISFNQNNSSQFITTKPQKQNLMNFKIYTQKYCQEQNNYQSKNINKQTKKKLNFTFKPSLNLNPKSKQLLLKKQKLNGVKYVPIHLRIDNQINKKKQNINKLKNQLLIRNQINLKQCTFRPNINKNHVVKRNPNELITNLYKWQEKIKQKKRITKKIQQQHQSLQIRNQYKSYYNSVSPKQQSKEKLKQSYRTKDNLKSSLSVQSFRSQESAKKSQKSTNAKILNKLLQIIK